ncbi:uncharacterized protein K460DRAFT_79537 [Cucurbitaria berberidis CBS 394.84]|uniref:Uncharacterized protein n=1 Tax=Cucurbitaria berberidis CBS 394.84 TaxID=1168544 RepID=A0A9P4LB47_9PLEO|nr:uncharacterized protein K460DRAFT_79537 [Cucurbitaria berberidis CBS 394.84]KAF1848690.1 hypothetical protein K460DRAFT_79537 [Cucurbitaria berberidis CBS 394.84]
MYVMRSSQQFATLVMLLESWTGWKEGAGLADIEQGYPIYHPAAGAGGCSSNLSNRRAAFVQACPCCGIASQLQERLSAC